jgi:predicted TPR repeat methyltransferase
MDLSENNLLALFQKAAGEFQLGQLADALKTCEQATSRYPMNADAHNNRGVILKEVGRLEEALESYRRALEINPNLAGTHFNTGLVLADLGRKEEALAAYDRAIGINPGYAEVHSTRGIALKDLNRFEEAITAWETALELNPALDDAAYFLASLGVTETPEQSPRHYITSVFDNCAERFDVELVSKLKYRAPEYLYAAVTGVLGNSIGELDIIDLGCGTGLCGVEFSGISREFVGVDLAPRMLEKARQRGVYSELIQADVCQALEQSGRSFDLILSADVFIYIGKLDDIFKASAEHLKPGGLLASSIETNTTNEDYILRATGRYAQSLAYMKRLADANRLEEVACNPVTLRYERGKPVAGNIFVHRKTP